MTPTSCNRSIGDSLQDVAKAAGLQSYEIPRDFIVEPTPFTLENGLLTGIRKLARPKLKEHLRRSAGAAVHRPGRRPGRPSCGSCARTPANVRSLETVSRAAAALLGAAAAEVPRRCAVHRSGRRLVVGVDIRQPAARDLRRRRAGRGDRQPRQRPCRHLPNTSRPNGSGQQPARRSRRFTAAGPPRSTPAI